MKILIFLLLDVLIFVGCSQPRCLKSHKEMKTSPMWIQQMCTSYDSKGACVVWMPIIHQEYEYEADVCDEFEKEN